VNIIHAQRVKDFIRAPKPLSKWARDGLAYERKLARALGRGHSILHNPQFFYQTKAGTGYCIPDIILTLTPECTVVIEVKLSYKERAIEKLRDLYCPVVCHALALPTPPFPLVVAKFLTPDAPVPALSLEHALCTNAFLIHWPGRSEFPLA
jgi:hypothetical protein